MGIVEDIRNALWKLQDLAYRDFQSRLVPTVPDETVIGVRMPELQKLAKQLMSRDDLPVFLNALPHAYYEENNLHAYIICNISAWEPCTAELRRFLPYVDNWATCDSLRPRCLGKNPERLLSEINQWLVSDAPYTVRFGLEMLMLWFLDENFKPEYLELAASVQRDEYYVKMMQAWYFATALIKQYDVALCYLTDNKLSLWVHNKTIQKVIESNCADPETKAYLRMLKKKK